MQGNYIEGQEILTATNGGLDIIFQLYPQAMGSETNRNRKFKSRDGEKTASTSLKQADDGNWLVTDFGGDSKPRNAIQCYMLEKSLDYVAALRELASNYNLQADGKPLETLKAEYTSTIADPADVEGTWTWQIRNHFTNTEIETIISKKVLSFLNWNSADKEKQEAAYAKIKTAFQEYHWHPLESYSLVKDRKIMTFTSTEQYPIFLIDEGEHQKLYQPKHADKSRRFMYIGKKPKDFIHGLDQLNKAYLERKKKLEDEGNDDLEMGIDDDEDTGKKSKKKESPKLPEVVLCSGGSDAINVFLLGYRVLWMNSETAKLYQYQYDKIVIMVEKFYQLPDIDATGKKVAHELAMEYLEIFTIQLPEELKKYRDARGNECKDLRDYLNHYTRKDFKLLVDIAMPYRFWEKTPKYEGRGDKSVFVGFTYTFNNVYGYNFLSKNGFARLLTGDKKTEWMFIHNRNGIVREVDASMIEDYIHDFLEERCYDIDLRNAMINTTRINSSSLAKLKKVNIDFTDNTPDSQFVFFTNKTVEVTKDKITYHKSGTVERYIWQEDLLEHRIEPAKQEPFTITKNNFDEFDIEIHDTDCPFFKYLIQTSRVHWREETERRLNDIAPADQEKYLKDNQFNIAGPNLKPEEIEEQKAHLINKIFSIGFLLHRYKARDKGWFVWGMDNKINEDGRSHGGSGKSILFDLAMRTMMPKNFYINGRDPKLTDDSHKYDGVTEHHRYLLIDDASEYIKLDAFYTDITGDVKVNPKGKQPYSIPFKKSAKFAFTTNYTPRDVGPSTERRMIYCVFSDWYHNKGESDDYLELRDPVMDLGLKLFDDFNQEQWNSFYNLMLHCLKFFLGTDKKMKPAMENVNKRNMLSEMGNLHDWALVYFAENSERLDTFIVREEAYTDYTVFNGKKPTPQSFSSRLKTFCRYYGYILNPAEYRDKHGKIIHKVEPKMYYAASNTWEPVANAKKVPKEVFYIQTKNELMKEVPEVDAPDTENPANLENKAPGAGADPDELPF